VLATLSATRSEHLVAGGDAQTVALTDGFHLAFLIGAALIGVAIVVALTVLRQPRPERAPVAQAAYSEA